MSHTSPHPHFGTASSVAGLNGTGQQGRAELGFEPKPMVQALPAAEIAPPALRGRGLVMGLPAWYEMMHSASICQAGRLAYLHNTNFYKELGSGARVNFGAEGHWFDSSRA